MQGNVKGTRPRTAFVTVFVPPLAVLAVALLSCATVIQADQITYVLSGIASGAIGGSTFTNALVQVTATGNTGNIVAVFGFALANRDIATTVTIQGVGTAAVTEPTATFSSVDVIILAAGFPSLPYVVIGTLDNPPALSSFTGIAALGDNALLGYNLKTSIGPITASPGGVGYPTGLFIPTTLGNLSFSSNFLPTGQGKFAAVATVPEPPSLLFLFSGIALLAGLLRFRPACSNRALGGLTRY